MLKKIPGILSPDAIKLLMEMGHGDEICLSDGNFPAHSIGRKVIRLDGQGMEPLLEVVLEFFPLDTHSDDRVVLMHNGDGEEAPPIWERYREIIRNSEESMRFSDFAWLSRHAFYERARQCYAVIATGESALYANIILRKGVVIDEREGDS